MISARILIVEDELIVARDIENHLTTLGYEIVGQTSRGDEVLSLGRQLQPDLVLMDIQLPGPVDGIMAAAAIRTQLEIPVVYLTAYADEATLERAGSTQPFGYVLKPFDERELRTVIEMALVKHRAERQLRRSEQRYATTLNSIGDAVIATDDAGRITFINPVAERLTGWPHAEGVGRPLDEVFRIINEETHQPAECPVARVLREGVILGLANHTLLLARDGRQFPIDDSAAPIQDAGGSISGAVLVFRDVGEKRLAEEALRQSESRFKAFMDNGPAVAFMKDEAGRYVYANRRWELQFPQPRTDWAGKTDFEFWPEETARQFRESDQKALASTSPIEVHEAGPSPEGELLHWLTFKFRLPATTGQRLIGGLALDISEKTRLEGQLRQAQKMEAIGQLAGGVAHDFNNLLTVINGYAGLLLQSMTAEHPWHGFVSQVQEAGERAADLTRQLLAFSRKQMVQPRTLDLNQVVARMRKMLERLIGENIHIVTELTPGIGQVRADPGQLEQVLVNLAVNARDAMPAGGTLTFATGPAEFTVEEARALPEVEPGRYCLLSVSDTGQGMAERVRNRIFEPFFTTKEVGKGTGLGLATVYGVIKQCGGHIAVRSALGQGTTFTIYLPALPEAAAEGTPSPWLPDLPRGRETVLLVEDEEPVRLFARQVLQLIGYTVLEACHGLEALELSRRFTEPIHLLLTDLVMPRMNGLEVYEVLRTERDHLRVLFVSGYQAGQSLPGEVATLRSAFLQKPFTPSELAHKLREVLDSKT